MAKKKNKIDVNLIRGNNISKTTKPDVELFNKLVEEGSKVEKQINPALLISRLDYPENVKYGDRTIRMSPRANVKIADANKIKSEGLPKGIFLKKLTATK